MSNSYYATITIPQSAQAQSPIRAWLEDQKPYGPCHVEHIAATLVIQKEDAKFGRVGVQELLQEHLVPYDHFHECHEGEPYVSHVRYDEAGEPVETTLVRAEQKEAALAVELLKLLDAGRTDALRARLGQLASNYLAPIVEIASSWQPADGGARPAADASVAASPEPACRPRG